MTMAAPMQDSPAPRTALTARWCASSGAWRTQAIDPRRYHVVPRTLVFVRRGDQVLLLRGAHDRPIWPGRYNGVGGHVEAGEGLMESARRETFEETGLAVHNICLAGLLHVTERLTRRGVLVFVFTAETAETAVRASSEGELCWVGVSEAAKLDLVPDLVHILSQLSWDRTAAPFVALSVGGQEGDLLSVEDGRGG